MGEKKIDVRLRHDCFPAFSMSERQLPLPSDRHLARIIKNYVLIKFQDCFPCYRWIQADRRTPASCDNCIKAPAKIVSEITTL